MSTDQLQDLFAEAGRNAPASIIDGDLVVRRGRRVRARRRAVVGTSALATAGIVALGSVALASAFPGGPDRNEPAPAAGGPAVVGDATTPAVPTPSVSTPPNDPDTPPAGLEDVALPDPAPGFPVRRGADSLDLTGFGPGRTYWVKSFLLAVEPETRTTDAAGNVSGTPNGPEVTILVGAFPMPATRDGAIDGHRVVASPSVAGGTGQLTSYREKGTEIRELYFSKGEFTVEVIGFRGVAPAQLVDLGNALTGLR